ncbi:MAG: hypothetical protein ACP5U0_08830, partial [Caldisphaera sp.]
GSCEIREVDGDKDIIVVIPTTDYDGKYARTCREEIFKGLHIVFVVSGKNNFYFNYAHNCNVGIKKALEYNPKWIVVSNDDMIKIDNVEKLKDSLKSILFTKPTFVYSKTRKTTANTVKLAKSTLKRKFLYYIVKKYTRNIISLEKKFRINYLVSSNDFPYYLLFKEVFSSFPGKSDFAIFSNSLLNDLPYLFDETFINGGEDIDSSLSIFIRKPHYHEIEFEIFSYGGGTLGKRGRMLKDIMNLAYLNQKLDLYIRWI